MDRQISFVTLAVADLAASRRFYVDGLGWQTSYADPDGFRWEVAHNPGPIGRKVLP